jgi:hypothetical protein
MNLWILPLALLCGLILSATAMSLFALWRAHSMLHAACPRPGTVDHHQDGDARALRQSVESLAARLRDLELQPPQPAAPGSPRPALNMTKRSQALRMHRQGDPPDQIAAALDLPRQEVDLLLKVHRIVLTNL